MDDTNKQSLQPSQPPASQQGGTLVQFPTPAQQVPQSQGPLSSGFPKEQEPMPARPMAQEFVAPTEQPVELEPDVKEAGVTEVAQQPAVSQDLAKMGVQASNAALPVEEPKKTLLKTPMSLEKAEQITKGSFLFKNPSSSLLWLAMLVVRQLRMKKKEEEPNAA